MKTIDVSAATVEEAISDGLAKLGCSISDCKVQILQEGAKGLFGLFGSKPAKVRLTLVSDEEEKTDDFSINLREAMDSVPETRTAPEKRPQPARQPRPAQPRKPAEAPKPVEKPVEKAEEKPAEAPVEKKNDVLERFKSAPLPGSSASEPMCFVPPSRRRSAPPVRSAPRAANARITKRPCARPSPRPKISSCMRPTRWKGRRSSSCWS